MDDAIESNSENDRERRCSPFLGTGSADEEEEVVVAVEEGFPNGRWKDASSFTLGKSCHTSAITTTLLTVHSSDIWFW